MTHDNGRMMKPGEVAAMFGVDPKTISRWAKAGRFGDVVRTDGGHLLIPESEARALLQRQTDECNRPRDASVAEVPEGRW